jgi:hypothetical protein
MSRSYTSCPTQRLHRCALGQLSSCLSVQSLPAACIVAVSVAVQCCCQRLNLIVSKKVKQSRYTPWRRLGGGRRYSSYSFSTSALDEGEWSASRPGRAFTPVESTPGTHCTGGWVGPRAGLDTQVGGKILLSLPGIESRSPGRPARSQTLYCLS